MEIITWEKVLSLLHTRNSFLREASALSIGSFDGPHCGHGALFDAVLAAARRKNIASGVVTFARPLSGRKRPEEHRGDVSTLRQRLDYCAEKGFDFAIVIDFSDEFGRMEGHVFLSALRQIFGMRFLAEGCDFHCGYHGATDIPAIQAYAAEHAVELEIVQPVMYGGERVSSSRIRSSVLSGDFVSVAGMLGRPYQLDCRDIEWKRENDTMYPASGRLIQQVLPCDGVYTVQINMSGSVSGGDAAYRAQLKMESQNLRLQVPSDSSALQIRTIEFI